MTATGPRRRPDGMGPFVGSALMAVGGLIASLCGLCTLWAIGRSGGYPDLLGLALMVGGPPTLIGVGLVWAGRKLLKTPGRRAPSAPANFTDEERES